MPDQSLSSIVIFAVFALFALAVFAIVALKLWELVGPLVDRTLQGASVAEYASQRMRRFKAQRRPDDEDNLEDLPDDTATLLSMLTVASIVVDAQDEVVRSSPDAYRLGVVQDDAIAIDEVMRAVHEVRAAGGRRMFDLTTSTPERFISMPSEAAASTGVVETASVRRPNWLKVTVGRINERFVVVLIDDVSDAVRFGQVRDSFITNVSEQLLGPTEALVVLADNLERGGADEERIARDARQVRDSCEKLNHMVADLLLLIKAQEPVTPSSANRLDLLEQVRHVADQLRPQAVAAGVGLHVDGDEGVIVNGEVDQIRTAITKLVENAIGYSPQGKSVSVAVSRAKTGDHAMVRVLDQGRGIAKEDQSRVFERFYRGTEQTSRTENGVGLGLAIVKHVALTHHGDVAVWSVPGSGSTFTLSLPLAR
ncbi:Histidine kinase-, DNA gyrase B-, and HSP90-like ATPase [Bifidobacterium lemurum]|uniref:Sensor-like histidine kinase SenX3 n=2 Tax=Bifidobacterium lemurum TaxID=1603886 RepID=A0A261FVG8_9BIFI|nr:Histidine kinase-, DNA gyrase B-, and HSP90-like ATPase [Bifidobacterium lemurum]QOL33499.1 ATPase [Bifidobacterium lemurum]